MSLQGSFRLDGVYSMYILNDSVHHQPHPPPLQPPIIGGAGGGVRSVIDLKPRGPNLRSPLPGFLLPPPPKNPPPPPPPPPPVLPLVPAELPRPRSSFFLSGLLSSIPTSDLKNSTKNVMNFQKILVGVARVSSTTSPLELIYTIVGRGWISMYYNKENNLSVFQNMNETNINIYSLQDCN